MHDTRIAEWLRSIGGIATSLSTAGAALFAIYAAIQGTLAPAAQFLGLEAGTARAAAQVAAVLLLLPILWFVVRSYRRFANASRLEQPDRFTLAANTPESLIGRAEDLIKLQDSVAKNRLVLLDGESGCGKSALVAAGLVPRLLASNGPLPVLIRDWGDDWVRGPLATGLGALFDVLTPEQRDKLGWTQPPDLAADASTLALELGKRFADVAAQLGRRPLLIVDQFDDYQARHHERFVDVDGNWMKPDVLAVANPFWALTRERLQTGALHLLAVTRADTASGLSCVRFLDTTMTVDRHLPRVDLAYLRPLLEGIAPADAKPVVVSHPDHGWHELRDRVEADLRLQGAVLMQQVRTVLLGIRQLPMLNVPAYRRAGGLRGTETLVIVRAISRAGDAVGGGEGKRILARRMLGALVLPGGANQPAKAKRASFTALAQLVGHNSIAKEILQTLQAEDVVRPAEGLGGEQAWQLDHDYLAHAVLAEARLADRWGIVLREGLEQFHLAGDAWRRRWTALLPSDIQARLAWERIRGRLRYGAAAGYARLSLLKPALAALVLGTASTAAYMWNEDRLLSVEAIRIYDRFGGANETAAVLDAWRAPQPVRDRLYRLVKDDESRLDRAVKSAWPHAHGGLDARSLLESAHLLRDRLARETDFLAASRLAEAYITVVAKLTDPATIHREAVALRDRLALETNSFVASRLAKAYATVAIRLTDPAAIQQAAAALRERLARETNSSAASQLAEAYITVAVRLTDPAAIQQAAAAMRERLARETNSSHAKRLAEAYETVAVRLTDQAAIQQAAAAMRERLALETNSFVASRLAKAYATVAVRLTDPAAIQQAAASLRERLARETDPSVASEFAVAYATVAARLTDPAAIQQAATALRERLARETNSSNAIILGEAYATVADRLTDPAAIQREATALRERLARETDSFVGWALARAYATAADRLTDPAAIQREATALRERLARETDPSVAERLAEAYATVAARLTDPAAIQQAATALRERLARETDTYVASELAEAYARVAARLTGQAAIRQAAAALRERLARETDPSDAKRLAEAYARVAARLTDPAAIQQAATALRERLDRETNSSVASEFAEAYATVAARLIDLGAIKQAATALHERLARETDSSVAARLAEAYATVAARLTEPAAVRQAATSLRERLARETNPSFASEFAEAYATVALRNMEDAVRRADKAEVASQVRQALVMAGHPFLRDSKSLLDILAPVSGRSFGSDLGAAVEWWVKEFKGYPSTLRPERTRIP